MAVTITGNPLSNAAKDVGFLSDPFEWTLEQSDIGSSVLENKIAYRLQEGANNLTSDKAILPKENDEPLKFDFAPLLRNLLHTNVPPNFTDWDVADTDMWKKVKLQPGEAVVDYADCDNNDTTWGTASSEYHIVNSYFQTYQDRPDMSGTNYIIGLQDLPLYKKLPRDQTDFLYIWGDPVGAQGTFVLDVWNNLGQTSQLSVGNIQYVRRFAMNVARMVTIFGGTFTQDNITAFAATINGRTTKWIITDPCAGNKVPFYFLQPKGGYSLEIFDCIERIQGVKTGTTITKQPASADFDTRKHLADFGTQWQQTDARVRMTLQKRVKVTKNNIHYYQALANSSKYLVGFLQADTNKSDFLEAFIPETIEIPLLQKDTTITISITGTYAQKFKAH